MLTANILVVIIMHIRKNPSGHGQILDVLISYLDSISIHSQVCTHFKYIKYQILQWSLYNLAVQQSDKLTSCTTQHTLADNTLLQIRLKSKQIINQID